MEADDSSSNNHHETALRSSSLDEDEPDSSNTARDESKPTGRLEGSPSNFNHALVEKENSDRESTTLTKPPGSVAKPVAPASEAEATNEDGADHAEDAPKIPWTPQNATSTCEFTHVINNYAQQRESGSKKAEYSEITVDEYGNQWRLIIYVNGNGRASNHHLSLFLQVADADDLPFGWKKSVSYVLTLEHPNGGTSSYAKRNPDKTFKLCPKAIDWGWSQFITSDRIQQEGFIDNDSLIVRASVTVKSSSVSIDKEDAELYLKCAVEEGNVDAVRLCLGQGASINCQFKDDLYTPLHTACSSGTSKGSIGVLNLLLEENADPNACNKWKETPLLIAANNGHTAACQALLENGADPSLCSEAGWSALTFAAHKGYDDIVKLLLTRGAPVIPKVTEDSSTPLHKACAGSKPGHVEAVKLLLAHDADVHALNKWRETPLLTAANHGQDLAVQMLLAAGADPCKCTDTGWSPLSIAAYKGHDEVVRLLLEEGTPTEEEDPTLSALLQAATKGLGDTVELLLQHGADHSVTTKKGDTALSILVEQNLIDAAVDMVMKYGASIPRCSRDRKKVQRARLMINLRIKQIDREVRSVSPSADGNETDGDDSTTSNSAQHKENDSGSTSAGKLKKKKNSGKIVGISAEEKAKAAEEALLMELAEEDEKARKEEAEANSKRAKKRKKKERERQQKLKEEQERRDREELEEKERERERQAKEDVLRQEREKRLREQQELEMREIMERETALAAKRRERERREREKKRQDPQPHQQSSPTNSDTSDERTKRRAKASQSGSLNERPTIDNGGLSKAAGDRIVEPLASNRRWETKGTGPAIQVSASSRVSNARLTQIGTETVPPSPVNRDVSVPVATPLSSVDKARVQSTTPSSTSTDNRANRQVNGTATPLNQRVVEHPSISLFRHEKVAEMIRKSARTTGVGEVMIKWAVYRWIVRAAHDGAQYLDPLVPSWNDFDKLSDFFQRQLVHDSRRLGAEGATSLEAFREAGAAVAVVCLSVARDIDALKNRLLLPTNWTDSAMGMSASERGTHVIVSYANRGSVVVPSATFAMLRGRYFGPLDRFLTAVFVAKLCYDTKNAIIPSSIAGLHLSSATKACLSSDFGVSIELWSDPFRVHAGNAFWGQFDGVDRLFGGLGTFAKEDGSTESLLVNHGGHVAVLPPLDATIAPHYVTHILDVLSASQSSRTPVTVVLFLHADCFLELGHALSPNDFCSLDPRLRDLSNEFVQRVHVLPAGRHAYECSLSAGGTSICMTNSLLVLLQNEAGRSRLDARNVPIGRLMDSMMLSAGNANPIVTPLAFPHPTPQSPANAYFEGLAQVSPDNQRIMASSEFIPLSGSSTPKAFSPTYESMSRNSRHGRLFDLVDDGEDDPMHGVDLVSGMLNSLDVGLFQGGSSMTPDIDIEAISLMGIGMPPPNTALPGRPHPGNFR